MKKFPSSKWYYGNLTIKILNNYLLQNSYKLYKQINIYYYS